MRTYGVEAQAKVTARRLFSTFGFGASHTRSSPYKFDSPGVTMISGASNRPSVCGHTS